MKKLRPLFIFILILAVAACGNTSKEKESASQTSASNKSADGSVPAITGMAEKLPLSTLKLPKGFSISVYAEVENARQLALSPAGTVFVGNNNEKKVYALRDTNGDGIADKKWVIASGLNNPNGVAFLDGDLYVAEIHRVTKFTGIESKLDKPGTPVVIYDKLPNKEHHGNKYIAFGPDGKLYIPVGAPCNICESSDPIFAAISRMNKDGSGFELFASGVRNTVGFAWHPDSKELWFTDNGRDMLGDDIPSCELNTAPTAGLHFGYPYCHAGTIKDPEFGDKKPCSTFRKPEQNLGAHVAPLGLKFYTGNMFPDEYKNQILLAEHGSWNRTIKSGYNITRVKFEGKKSTGFEPFISGWLDNSTQKVWGRPVDVLVMPDGAILISDDYAGVIYRVSYKG